MKLHVAGIELDLPDVVWIFDEWATTPVFHRADFTGELGRLVTACGIPTTDRPGGYRSADGLPPKHATKFARPCAHCWPQLRSQPSLFTRRPGPGATRHEQEAMTL